MIEVQEKDIEHREKELQATVRLPAEADAEKVRILAEAAKYVYQYFIQTFDKEKYYQH